MRWWIFCKDAVLCWNYGNVFLYMQQSRMYCILCNVCHTLHNTLYTLTRYSNSQLSIPFHLKCKILVAACVSIRLLVTVAIKCFQPMVSLLPINHCNCITKYANVRCTCCLRDSFQQSHRGCGFLCEIWVAMENYFVYQTLRNLHCILNISFRLKFFLQMQRRRKDWR